jgi:hypothetical protein
MYLNYRRTLSVMVNDDDDDDDDAQILIKISMVTMINC